MLVYTGWVVSVEITPDIIRYGALRKADLRTRRGLGTVRAKPYAKWLYEYRCPIPALKLHLGSPRTIRGALRVQALLRPLRGADAALGDRRNDFRVRDAEGRFLLPLKGEGASVDTSFVRELMVTVKATKRLEDWVCEVAVDHAGERSRHTVTVTRSDLERWGHGDVEDLVKRSFDFLLEREPQSSILKNFDLSVIQRYFPEYDREIRR